MTSLYPEGTDPLLLLDPFLDAAGEEVKVVKLGLWVIEEEPLPVEELLDSVEDR